MESKRSGWIVFLNVLIYGILAGMVTYALLRPLHYKLQMATVAVSAIMASVLVWTGGPRKREIREGAEAVAKIVLLDDDGERVKEWFVKGETSVLIGKNGHRGEVDIDLSDCEYASLVSPEHAVLNRVGDRWYIEDTESHSGTGLRKAGSSETRRLVAEEPQEIGTGDMVFIANTRLLVK
ncbi:FHA domain-containing protein [Paenibacillus sanfengchensis]|uniref:FHA domain-containing protein n=1 Tax=Paenibacillus sanfengchensis TaxID=3119819 RepID=UPI002FE015AB